MKSRRRSPSAAGLSGGAPGQVSHHPPIAAAHAENAAWVYDIVSAPTTKFLGNSVDIYPVGAAAPAGIGYRVSHGLSCSVDMYTVDALAPAVRVQSWPVVQPALGPGTPHHVAQHALRALPDLALHAEVGHPLSTASVRSALGAPWAGEARPSQLPCPLHPDRQWRARNPGRRPPRRAVQDAAARDGRGVQPGAAEQHGAQRHRRRHLGGLPRRLRRAQRHHRRQGRAALHALRLVWRRAV